MRKVGKIEPVGLSAPGASASSPMLAAQGRPSMTLDGQAARLASLQYDLETTLEIVGVLRDRVCGPASASDAAFAPSSHPDGLVALVEHRIDLIRGLQERIDTAIAEIARAIG